ncbi:MAG: DUF4397 domain-containing protein [Terriglobales bacterium]|jgi:hypothetical protein
MSRLLKTLPLALAIAAVVALGVFAASCNSNSNALVRVVNCIPDNGTGGTIPLDVYVNGTKYFTDVRLGQAYPTPQAGGSAQYTSVPAGSVTFQAYDTGSSPTTPNAIWGAAGRTANLSGGTQYTVLLSGYVLNSGINPIPDNNTAPTTGDLTIRAINGSATYSGGVDVLFYQTGEGNPGPGNAQITDLQIGQGQYVRNITWEPSYTMEVYNQGQDPIIQGYTLPQGGSGSNGPISTVVLFDNGGGTTGISQIPLVLNDLY